MVKTINNRGSMTVEAAFVLPMIILILIAMMLGSMYMYNKIKFQTDTRELEQFAEVAIEKKRDRLGPLRFMTDPAEGITADVMDHAYEILSEGYFFLNGSAAEFQAGHDAIKINISLRMNILPIPVSEKYLKHFRTIDNTGEKKVCDYAEKARLYRVVIDTGKKTNAVNENSLSVGQLIGTEK